MLLKIKVLLLKLSSKKTPGGWVAKKAVPLCSVSFPTDINDHCSDNMSFEL